MRDARRQHLPVRERERGERAVERRRRLHVRLETEPRRARRQDAVEREQAQCVRERRGRRLGRWVDGRCADVQCGEVERREVGAAVRERDDGGEGGCHGAIVIAIVSVSVVVVGLGIPRRRMD